MGMRSYLPLAVVLICAGAAPAVANPIIYDNGPLARGGANEIGAGADSSSNGQLADDFVLSIGDTITGVRWWGTDSLPVDDFTIQFFEDDGASPADTALASFAIGEVVETPVSFGGFFDNVFQYEASIAPLTLNLGTTYWLSIINDSPITWFWAVAGPGNFHFRNDAIDWRLASFPSELGFVLTGPLSVPEPPSAALLIIGLAGGIAIRFRRSRPRGD